MSAGRWSNICIPSEEGVAGVGRMAPQVQTVVRYVSIYISTLLSDLVQQCVLYMLQACGDVRATDSNEFH